MGIKDADKLFDNVLNAKVKLRPMNLQNTNPPLHSIECWCRRKKVNNCYRRKVT